MLRVVGGTLRGRRFAAPSGRHTRPTADKVREAIFNTLTSLVDLSEIGALDLFAGSGALGIEALSRGAAHCVFVESHGRTAAGIRENLQQLGISRDTGEVVTTRVEAWLRGSGGGTAPDSIELVLADPPYAYPHHEALLASLAECPAVAKGAVVVLESAEGQGLTPHVRLEVLRTKRYGDTQVTFLRKSTSPPGTEPST